MRRRIIELNRLIDRYARDLDALRAERDQLLTRIDHVHQAALLTDQPYALEATAAIVAANTRPALPPDVPALRLFEEEDPERWDFMS